MQDIAIAIGEKIHELIILEIRRIRREVMEQQEEIKRRLDGSGKLFSMSERHFPHLLSISSNQNERSQYYSHP